MSTVPTLPRLNLRVSKLNDGKGGAGALPEEALMSLTGRSAKSVTQTTPRGAKTARAPVGTPRGLSRPTKPAHGFDESRDPDVPSGPLAPVPHPPAGVPSSGSAPRPSPPSSAQTGGRPLKTITASEAGEATTVTIYQGRTITVKDHDDPMLTAGVAATLDSLRSGKGATKGISGGHAGPGGYTVTSTPRSAKFVVTATQEDGAAKILSPRDLRKIRTAITTNENLPPRHRTTRVADTIPSAPFAKLTSGAEDAELGLRVAPINPKESALDVPLRLAIPAELHLPPLYDPPRASSSAAGNIFSGGQAALAVRLSRLLKGTAHEPQAPPKEVAHDGEAQPQRTVAHTRILRDWETKAQVARRAGQPVQYATALLAVAGMHYGAGSYRLAAAAFTQSAEAFRAADVTAGAALCYNLAGAAHMRLSQFREALVCHEQQGELSGSYGRTVACINIGVCYGHMGEAQFALEAHTDAAGHAVDSGDSVLHAVAIGNQAIAALRAGDVVLATSAAEDCLERCSVAGDKVGAAVCLLLLGDVYARRDDHDPALFYFEHALRVSNESSCTDLAALATVGAGLSRGAQRVRQVMFDQAAAMGQEVGATDLIAALPK